MVTMSAKSDRDNDNDIGFMNTLFGHSNLVKSLTYFPALSKWNDYHKYIITGSATNKKHNKLVTEGEFIMWDLQTYRQVIIWYGHSKPVSAMSSLSRLEDRVDFLFSGSEDGVIIIWKFSKSPDESFSKLHIIEKAHNERGVTKFVVYSPPNYYYQSEGLMDYLLISLGGDGIVKVWNLDKILTLKNEGMKLLPKDYEDQNIVKVLFYWDPKDRRKTIFSSDSNTLFPYLNELLAQPKKTSRKVRRKEIKCKINLTNRETSIVDNKVYQLKGDKFSAIDIYIPKNSCVKHCEDKICICCRKALILVGWKNRILLFDLATREVIAKKNKGNNEEVLFFSGHTKEVTTICICDPSDTLFNFNRNRHSSSFKETSHKQISSPILISGSKDGTIIIWDLLQMTKIRNLPDRTDNFIESLTLPMSQKLEKGHSGRINSISAFDYSTYGNCPQIVSTGGDNKIIIWDILSGQRVRTISGGHDGAIVGVSVTVLDPIDSYNESKVKIASFSNDSNAFNKSDNCIIWELAASRLKPNEEMCDSEITVIKVFEPNNNISIIIASHKNGMLSFWDGIRFKSIGSLFKKNETNGITSMTICSLGNHNYYDIMIATCHGNFDDIGGRIIQLTKVKSNEITKFHSISLKMKSNILCLDLIAIPMKHSHPILYLIAGCCSPKKDENNEINDIVPVKILEITRIYENYENKFMSYYDKPVFIKKKSKLRLTKQEEQESKLMGSYDKFMGGKKTKRILTLEEDKNELEVQCTVGDHTINHTAAIRCLATFSNANDEKNNIINLVTGSDDQCVMIWKLSIVDTKVNAIPIEFEGLKSQKVDTKKYLKIDEYSVKFESKLIHHDKVKTLQCVIPRNNRKYPSPIIVSGCYDNNIYLWDSKTGQKLTILSGHSEVVTSICIYDNPDSSFPLLISSSLDKTIIVWKLYVRANQNIFDSVMLRKLIGHNDRIYSVDVVNSQSRKPTIISGGFDKALIAWQNGHVLAQSMPTQHDVLRGFKLDLDIRDNHHWPIMRKLTFEYGLGLWIENAGLFFVALRKKQVSFFVLFKYILAKVIRHTWWIPERLFGNNEKAKNSEGVISLLSYALEKSDFQIIDIILDCLLENINEDITDSISQRLSHVSYLVNQKDLLSLSSKYPALFIKFISRIRLVKTDQMLNKSNKKVNIKQLQSYADSSSKHIVDAYNSNDASDMWKILLDNNNRSKSIYTYTNIILSYFKPPFLRINRNATIQPEITEKFDISNDEDEDYTGRPVTSKYLPILDPGSIALLDRCVNVSLDEKSLKIFESVVGQTILDYLWRRYAFFSHFCQTVVYLVYVILYSYLIYRFHAITKEFDKQQYNVSWALEILLLVWTVFYLLQELYQIYYDIQKYNLYEQPFQDKKHSNNVKQYRELKKSIYTINNRYTFRDIILIAKDFIFLVLNLFIQFTKLCESVFIHFYDIWKFNNLVITILVLTATIKRLVNLYNEKHNNNDSTVDVTNFSPSSFNNSQSSYPTGESSSIGISVKTVDSDDIKCIYAIATICIYFKILYFLRPFPHYGPLVSIIIRVAKDILRFLSILLLIMCGFAQAYWILNENTDSLFGTSIWKAYLYSFFFMLGQLIDPNTFNDSASFPLNILLLAFFMIFMILLMLNLLIALMNDSYKIIKENSLATWRLEQGGIILDDPYIATILKNQKDHYIYTLNYSSVSDNNFSDKDENKLESLFEDWKRYSISNKEIINIIQEVTKRDETHFFFIFERDDSEDQIDANQQLKELIKKIEKLI